LAQERHAAPRLYQMLLGALRTLAVTDPPLLVPAFFLKLLSLEGFHPLLDACASCDSPAESLVAFDLGEGGALCRSCAGRLSAVALSPDGLALVRRVLGGDLAGALREPAGRATA